MRAARSPSTSRPYPLTMICQVWRVARSSVYATASPLGAASVLGKRGPKTLVSDPDLVAAIRRVLSETPFHGEGYRKVRARLAHRGVAVGGKRVLRLMRRGSNRGGIRAKPPGVRHRVILPPGHIL
jgi:putative transposase